MPVYYDRNGNLIDKLDLAPEGLVVRVPIMLADSQPEPHRKEPMMARQERDMAFAQFNDHLSNAWKGGSGSIERPSEIVLPKDVIDRMTASQRSSILPALATLNTSDSTMRNHAVEQLRAAARKVTQSSPGFTADGADNQHVANYVFGLCDAALAGA